MKKGEVAKRVGVGLFSITSVSATLVTIVSLTPRPAHVESIFERFNWAVFLAGAAFLVLFLAWHIGSALLKWIRTQ